MAKLVVGALLGRQTMYSSGLTLRVKRFCAHAQRSFQNLQFCSVQLGCCLFFFFHGGIFTNFDNPYYTHRHHYL